MQYAERVLKIILIAVTGAAFALAGWYLAPGARGLSVGARDTGQPSAGKLSPQDLPMMPGMQLVSSMRNKSGKGMILRLSVEAGAADALGFYSIEMPARGWKASGGGSGATEVEGAQFLCFVRQNRVCIIGVEEKDAGVCVVNVMAY